MEFKINPSAYSNMFPIPSCIVDENIRLASAVQLKAMLYMLRHNMMGETVSCEQIGQALGYDKDDIADAMIFWLDRGLVIKSEEKFETMKAPSQPIEAPKSFHSSQPTVQEMQNEKTVSEIPVTKPTHEQVAARCSECAEFRELFAEAQMKLGKTIGYDGQSTLIMMHDSYGLPIEVILMLIEYAVSKGKTGYKYLTSLARTWCEKEIDTLEAAEEYIRKQNDADRLWQQFRNLTGAENVKATTKQRQYFASWGNALGFDIDVIYLAYEICIDRTERMSLAYMDKILKNWHSQGVKTPMDVQKIQNDWAAEKKKKNAKSSEKASTQSSYDIDAFTKKGIGLKYKAEN